MGSFAGVARSRTGFSRLKSLVKFAGLRQYFAGGFFLGKRN